MVAIRVFSPSREAPRRVLKVFDLSVVSGNDTFYKPINFSLRFIIVRLNIVVPFPVVPFCGENEVFGR